MVKDKILSSPPVSGEILELGRLDSTTELKADLHQSPSLLHTRRTSLWSCLLQLLWEGKIHKSGQKLSQEGCVRAGRTTCGAKAILKQLVIYCASLFGDRHSFWWSVCCPMKQTQFQLRNLWRIPQQHDAFFPSSMTSLGSKKGRGHLQRLSEGSGLGAVTRGQI